MRSATWALGSQQITREPSGKPTRCSTASTAAIWLRCAIWTPFGGPVVPDGVDQREDVVGLDRAPVRLGVEARVLLPLADDEHVLDEAADQRHERRLDDRDPGGGVLDHVARPGRARR